MLEAVKARPGNGGVRRNGGVPADLDSSCARRPRDLRSGRKKACGAVEQKKDLSKDERVDAPWSTRSATASYAAKKARISTGVHKDTQRAVREVLRLANIQFGEEQAETARKQLAESISASREIMGSGKLATLRNLRNKHIAHALTSSREEKKGVAFVPRQPGDERDILEKTIPIVEKLHCWINGAGFDLNNSRETDRKYAESPWRSCTFTIDN